MEIDSNMKWGAVSGLPPATNSGAAAPQPPASADPFAKTDALEGALKNTPDVRDDAVANGRALVSDSGYPSDETVKKLSDFLADQFQSDLE
jgi:hypothetical protein